MKEIKSDFTNMTLLCEKLNMFPCKDINGNITKGIYAFKNLHAPVDLSACAEDETSILKTALTQLSEMCETAFQIIS